MYTPLDRGMVLLPLCRWKYSLKDTLQQTLFNLNWFLFTKMTNLLFEPPFGYLGITYAHRWKARGRLPIRDSWTFLASSYGWDVISKYWWKSALFRRCGSLWAQILRERGVASSHCWCHKTRVTLLPHSRNRVILRLFVREGYQRVTDRQTDGRNCRR